MPSLLAPFLDNHHVFRQEEALGFLTGILGTREASRRIRGLLGYQLTSGALVSLRHGLYATSGQGQPKPNQYLIAGKAAEDSVIGFQAALEWHVHMGKRPVRKFHIYASGIRANRLDTKREVFFIPVKARLTPALNAGKPDGVQRIKVQGCTVRITTRERTIVDVLDRPDLADDLPACWKDMALLSGPLDLNAIAAYLREVDCATTTARVGYFLSGNLDRFGLTGTDLNVLPDVPAFPHAWEAGAQGKPHPVWNIIVPPTFILPGAEAFTMESLYGLPASSPSDRLKGGRSPEEINLRSELSRRFGKKYTRFLEGQEAIIRAVLEGRDALAILPTAGGKSLTYQFPAEYLNGVTLVISPLLSLMEDQVREARGKRLCAVALRSVRRKPKDHRRGTPRRKPSAKNGVWGTFAEVARLLAGGKLDLLFVSPESIPNVLRRLPQLRKVVIQLVVDEAHLIHTWGRDFREGYRQLGSLRDAFPSSPVLALTATATKSIRQGILTELRMEEGHFEEQRLPLVRRRLFLQRKQVARGNFESRFAALLSFIEGREGQPGIIFCATRKETEKVAKELRAQTSRKARAYHAGLKDAKRRAVQNAFVLRNRCEVVAATVAFGMGVNKKNVRWVVHFGLPASLEGYVQEVGRAGRDIKWADCLLIHAPKDRSVWEFRLKAEEKKVDECEDKILKEMKREYLLSRFDDLESMTNFSKLTRCLHQFIREHFSDHSDPCGESCEECQDPADHHLLSRMTPPTPPDFQIIDLYAFPEGWSHEEDYGIQEDPEPCPSDDNNHGYFEE